MNFKTLYEIERKHINLLEDEYEKPQLRFKHRALSIYESINLGYFYIFLSDWFICAFHVNGTVEFLNEECLKQKFA